jgi:hypothetical protein
VTIIEGLTDSPQQQLTIVLQDGSPVVLTIAYKPQQLGWFYSLTWKGNPVCNGQRLVVSPNILRQYINVIPFGIACLTNGNVEPTGQEDLVDGLTTMLLLQGQDISLVESTAFGQPAQPLQATATLSNGTTVIIPPSQWGPASGDLSGNYPNPKVIALHVGDGSQLSLAAVADGQFLKRSGGSVIGATPSAGGNVTGPVSSTDGDIVLFNGASGTLIKDSGITIANLSAGFLAANAAVGGDLAGTVPNPTLKVIGSAATVGDATHVAQVTIDTKGRVTGLTAVLITAGGGSGIPSGGATGQRLVYGGSSGTAAWGNDAYVYASDYGFGAAGNTVTQNTTALQNAVNAAANANACLLLPPGVFHINAAITLPSSYNGYFRIMGCGRKITRIVQDTASINGFFFDCSAGGRTCAAEVQDIAVLANTGVSCSTAITITYGTTSLGSVEDRSLSGINNVEVAQFGGSSGGGGWTNGFQFTNCWHLSVDKAWAYGSLTNYTTGSGAGTGGGFTWTSCFNCLCSNLTSEAWHYAFSEPNPGPLSPSQGILLSNLLAVECLICMYAVSVAVYCDSFLFDNGNSTGVAGRQCVNMTNCNSSIGANGSRFTSGQMLQGNGTPDAADVVYMNNCGEVTITGVDFTDCPVTGSVIHFVGNTSECTVTTCVGSGSLFATGDAGTANNIVSKIEQGQGCSDLSGNNKFGDPYAFSTVQSLAGGTSFAFSVAIPKESCFGRKATSAPIQVVDPVTGFKVTAAYDFSNASNTYIVAFFKAQAYDLGTLPTGAFRFGGVICP